MYFLGLFILLHDNIATTGYSKPVSGMVSILRVACTVIGKHAYATGVLRIEGPDVQDRKYVRMEFGTGISRKEKVLATNNESGIRESETRQQGGEHADP